MRGSIVSVDIGNIKISNELPLLLIAGPCVIESKTLAEEVSGTLKEITDSISVPFIYK